MKFEFHGPVAGTIAAIVLVPLVRFIWRRFAPATVQIQLSTESRRRNAALSKEALIAALACLTSWGLRKGFDAQLSSLDVGAAIGIILGAPLWWILIRTRQRGGGALAEYAAYVEAHDGISFRSLCAVSVLATTIGLVCAVLSWARNV